MADAVRAEIDAFFSFFATFELTRAIATVADLSDGAALLEVLALVDEDYFRQSTKPSPEPSDNWVIRLNGLKRLYRLLTQYFADVLHKPTSGLEVPDLQAIAKDHNVPATLVTCRMALAVAVQCENNKEIIERIQKLNESDQHHLMKAIEQVMTKIDTSTDRQDTGEAGMTEDDHYYLLQSERSQALTQKETLEKVYQALLEEHRTLQTNYDDAVSEKDDALVQLRDAQRHIDTLRSDKADVMMRAEIDRLRSELQKSEDNLAMTEAELDKNTSLVSDMKRRIDELQSKADEAVRLKDQVDEYRHAADKLQKTENVMEKYKKKLQESADLRQHVKSLEKQNADLVDKNASLEEEYRKVAAFKPLMESYKSQISDLENKASGRNHELESLKFELEQCRTKLRITTEERAKDSEALELYQERVRELELMSTRPVPSAKPADESKDESGNQTEMIEAELLDEHESFNLGGELDDAITGTTTTDLKLQIRKLERELQAVRKNEADASRILVLENMLEDANRMKSRYESDYLAAHREKLVLQRDLEEIRSGKSFGDGAEAAIALRQRLNETVDEFDTLRKAHTELEVQYETQSKELTIAKSDLNLVNKDQLDILSSLRESVNEDKAGLQAETDRLQDQLREIKEKNRMQLEQINALLLEKVNLQSEGIGQRERMLQRERDFGELRASLNGKDLPEDIKTRLLAMHEDNLNLREQVKSTQEKLTKAKQLLKTQDKLYKEAQAKLASGILTDASELAGGSAQTKEEIERLKRVIAEMTHRYAREQELILSAIHSISMPRLRDGSLGSRAGPTAWLGQQRKNLGHTLKR